jgi:GNAT superfamily N-acetyltransferase
MIRFVTHQDIEQWLELAKEVEPLFGEMVGIADFCEGIKECIANSSALCLTHADDDVIGIIAVNKEKNEIEWLAVKNKYRGNGYGYRLVDAAIQHLDTSKPIYVQTFSSHVESGKSARKLYLHFGFKDYKDGGKNPAGIDTTIMKLD